MLNYGQLNPKEKTSVAFASKSNLFSFKKKIFSKCCFQNICHFIQASLHVLMDCIGNNIKNLCRELVCITVKWTWYNGRDIFFHITSGRIDTCKGVNQLKELFFHNLIIIFLIYVWNWQIIGIIWLKTHYFSQFITKMGFCCKILSLNDLTPSPISRPGTHCLQWQRANARTNLWWRHKPFPVKPAWR